MAKPWISIAIPSFNRAELLLRAIRSVQNQSDQEWELFIVDDQSTDSAWDVAQMVSKQDPRIHCQRNHQNRGLAGNFSYAATKGQAPYVLLLAADDQLAPDFLERMRKIGMHRVGLLCGRRVLFYPRTKRRIPYAIPLEGQYAPGSTVARALANGNLYGLYSSVVMRRDALRAVGGIASDNPWAGDYEAFVRIAARESIWFEPKAIVYQHVDHSTQTSHFLRSGQLVSYEMMTLSHLLSDPAVIRHLAPNDVRNAWRRIHALEWSVTLYRWLHGQWQRAPSPSAIEGITHAVIPSCSVGEIAGTTIRLIYQRWRLTY